MKSHTRAKRESWELPFKLSFCESLMMSTAVALPLLAGVGGTDWQDDLTKMIPSTQRVFIKRESPFLA